MTVAGLLCYPPPIANNSASSIRTALNTHLTALVTANVLKQVKIGRDSDSSAGYPFCRFFLDGVESDAVDNAPSDYRTYRFRVDVVQQFTALSVADAEAAFEDAVDAVLDKLNSKWQLPDGASAPTVDNSVIEVSGVQVVEANSGPALFVSILLAAKTLVY